MERLVIGAVLAGGEGSRMDGRGKSGMLLAGRPLASYPLEALGAVCERVALVCKQRTELPELQGMAERWDEPDEPRHPLTGIVHALERAGESVLVCAADMPFVTPDACRSLLGTPRKAPAAVAAADGVLQPTFGVYSPEALDTLRKAPPDEPLTRTIERLDPARVALPMRVVLSVNTPADLAEAERLLGPTT